jgi:hypothetical protein
VVNLSDREISAAIVESCRAGDRDAFRVLYDLYKDRVYSISLYFFHGDRSEACEATQQVFLKLMTSIGQFSRGGGVLNLALPAGGKRMHGCRQAAQSGTYRRGSAASGSVRPGELAGGRLRARTNGGIGTVGRRGSTHEVPNRRALAVFRGSLL